MIKDLSSELGQAEEHMIDRIFTSCGACLLALALITSNAAAAPQANEDAAKSTTNQATVTANRGDQRRRLDVDRNRTRYGLTASAFTLNAGESYLSQKQLFATAFSYGLTDHLTISASTVFPIWLNPSEIHVMPALKYGLELNDQWRVALGFESIKYPSRDGLLVHPYAAVTYGGQRHHVTMSWGNPFFIPGLEVEGSRYYPMTLSANISLNEPARSRAQFRLILDNIALFYYSGHLETLLYSVWALRTQWTHWSFDVGAFLSITESGLNLPIPWLDVTYNF